MSDYAINDKVMKQEIVSDLMESYCYTEKDAKAWAEELGSEVVSGMWDAYNRYIEENAEYKGIEND